MKNRPIPVIISARTITGDRIDFSSLVNKDLNELGKASHILWFSIGNPYAIEMPYSDGVKKKTVSDYAIHFQCQWRFVNKGKILLASHDIYNPYDKSLEEDVDWDWDIPESGIEQSSVFDVRSKEFMSEFFSAVNIKHSLYRYLGFAY